MRKFFMISASLVMLSGCVSTLESLGLTATEAATVSTDALTDGTLACEYGGTIAAVVGTVVTGATGAAVAAACGAISVADKVVAGAVPSPLPAGSVTVPVATVPAPVAKAVTLSVGTSGAK